MIQAIGQRRIWLFFILVCSFFVGCSGGVKLTPLSDDAVVLAFGDSLTFGYGPDSADSYPTLLADLIRRDVINAGISGEISKDGLARLPGLLEKHRPDLVILCHGGNDILRKFDLNKTKANLSEMISLIRDSGAQVVMIGVPKPSIFLSTAEVYGVIADEMKVVYEARILANTLNDTALKKDSIHPNEKGNAAIAEAVADLLKSHGAL